MVGVGFGSFFCLGGCAMSTLLSRPHSGRPRRGRRHPRLSLERRAPSPRSPSLPSPLESPLSHCSRRACVQPTRTFTPAGEYPGGMSRARGAAVAGAWIGCHAARQADVTVASGQLSRSHHCGVTHASRSRSRGEEVRHEVADDRAQLIDRRRGNSRRRLGDDVERGGDPCSRLRTRLDPDSDHQDGDPIRPCGAHVRMFGQPP